MGPSAWTGKNRFQFARNLGAKKESQKYRRGPEPCVNACSNSRKGMKSAIKERGGHKSWIKKPGANRVGKGRK